MNPQCYKHHRRTFAGDFSCRQSGNAKLDCDKYLVEIPDNSPEAQLFKQQHPHLAKWLMSGAGQAWERRRAE